jgi:hypothetical protein
MHKYCSRGELKIPEIKTRNAIPCGLYCGDQFRSETGDAPGRLFNRRDKDIHE